MGEKQMVNKVHDDDFGANRCCPGCDKDNQQLTLANLMLTEEERRKKIGCTSVYPCFESKQCVYCLDERAAIIKAVRVLGEAICADCGESERFVASCDKCPLKPLLKEVGK
jgi:hypothetical protein